MKEVNNWILLEQNIHNDLLSRLYEKTEEFYSINIPLKEKKKQQKKQPRTTSLQALQVQNAIVYGIFLMWFLCLLRYTS